MEDDILAPFLKTLRDVSQNFDTNLEQLLEDYLTKIGMSDSEAEEVLDSKVFTEAAILLQESVNIYGKKVDYLWQLLMQVLERNKLVGQKIANEKKNDKKQLDQYFSPDFCEVDDKALFSADVNINISYEPFSEIKFLPKYNPQLEAGGHNGRNVLLYGPQTNVIGKKYDFRVNKYLSSEGLLVDEPEVQKEVRVSLPCDTDSRMEETEPIGGMLLEDDSVDVEQCNIIEPIQDCGLPEVSQCSKSRCSKEGSYTEKASMSHRDSSKIINIYEEAWKPCPVDMVVPNKRFVKKVTYKVPPDLDNVTDEEIKKKVFDVSMEKRQSCSSILSFIMTNSENRITNGSDFLFDDECLHLSYGLKKSQPVLDQQDLSKLQAEFDEMAEQLALEFNDVEPDDSEEEGARDAEQEQVEDDDNSSEDENFDLAEENLEDLGTYIDDIKFPILDQLGSELQSDLMIPRISENDLTYTQYALEACSTIALERESLQGISSNVREWHDKLRPELEAASERGHYDIKAYGEKIINSFPESGDSTISFGDIVEGENSKDVPRFFLAALILANSYNVEISKGGEGDLEMDSVNLTLLNPVLNNGNINMENLCEKDVASC